MPRKTQKPDTGSQLPQPLLTVKQVAELLATGTSTIYALFAAGKLPYVNVGVKTGRRVKPEDLEQFIEDNREYGTKLPTNIVFKHLR
jgi:excisionase family DNA binding protein